MTSRTRYFVIVSLLVLTVGLGTGLLAYFGGLPTSALSRPGGPDELQFIPANASLLAYADVHAVMTSPLREKLRSILPMKENGQDEFAAQTGIHIDTDIDRIVAAVAAAPGTSGHTSGVVLARGRFDVVKIEALMREHGGKVEEYEGKRLIVGDAPAGKSSVSAAFMEPGLIAFGSSEMVRSAAALSHGGASVTTNDEIMNLVRDLDSGNAWAVGRFDEFASKASLPVGVSERLPAIQWFSTSVFVDSNLRGVIRAVTRDDEAANSLRDVVRGILALARLQSPGHPEVDLALRSLDLGGTGKTVALSFDVPAALFDSLSSLTAPRAGVQR